MSPFSSKALKIYLTKSFFSLLLFWTALASHGQAQNVNTAKLDAYFDSLATHNRFMGSVAVARKGELVYAKSIGFVDVEQQLPAHAGAKYRIGSISKTFTTVLVMKAVELKKVKLDEHIHPYFPKIENAKSITVRQLLQHRSGIANFTNHPDYLTYHTEPKSKAEMVALIAKGGSVFTPDSRAEYSNANFVLLTYLLEMRFKKSYADLLQEYIAQPLGLENTYLGGPAQVEKNECRSYRYADGWVLEPETDMSIPLGAGGIVSTTADLLKFSEGLFFGDLLKPESLAEMKNLRDNYGLGLFQFPFYERVSYGHTGGIDGFTSAFSCFEQDSLSYVLLSNGSDFNNNQISLAVLSAVFGKDFTIPNMKKVQLEEAVLETYVGEYASAQFPLKVTISREGRQLYAQATGQPVIPLEATAPDAFRFEPAGIVMRFNAAENSMTLQQGPGEYLFKKE